MAPPVHRSQVVLNHHELDTKRMLYGRRQGARHLPCVSYPNDVPHRRIVSNLIHSTKEWAVHPASVALTFREN